jgi:hypothetical protein
MPSETDLLRKAISQILEKIGYQITSPAETPNYKNQFFGILKRKSYMIIPCHFLMQSSGLPAHESSKK